MPLPLTLLALALQAPPPDAEPRVTAVGGLVTREGRLEFGRLGLGDGGVGTARGAPRSDGDGRFLTSGGVLVRSLAEGVKLDFPSGGELLIDPRGRVHVRDGSCTLPSWSGVRIALLDGAVVEVLCQNGTDLPLRQVTVRDGGTDMVLWRAGRAVAHRDGGGPFRGRTYHAFGDGRVLYEVADVGPTVVLDRVLCPRELEASMPPRSVTIVGDVLARSLVEVEKIAQQRAAGDPRTQKIASALAYGAPRMFGPGSVHARPAGARGDLVVPLDGGFRLQIDIRDGGPVVLGLFSPNDDVALCEWATTNVTRLHLVQREAGENGKPRYLMRGEVLSRLLDPLLGFEPSATARARARRVLVELGARRGDEAVPLAPKR